MITRYLIFVHRWLGVALCIVFLLWFPSGIGMMYWDYPSVSPGDRLDHSPPLDASKIVLSPSDAAATLGEGEPPGQIRLNTFDGRPVYRFRSGRGEAVVLRRHRRRADRGDERAGRSRGRELDRPARGHGDDRRGRRRRSVDASEPAFQSASALEILVAERRAGVRLGSHRRGRAVHDDGVAVGRVCRRHPALALLHAAQKARTGVESARDLVVGHRDVRGAPRRHDRHLDVFAEEAVSLRGRAHQYSVSRTEALAHDLRPRLRARRGDVGVQRHALDGSVSVDADRRTHRPSRRRTGDRAGAARPRPEAFARKHPREALAQLAGTPVKELELSSFAGEPIYLATAADGRTRIVPVNGEPREEFDRQRIVDVVTKAAEANGGAEVSVLEQYDMYYLDRRRTRPLPVILARAHDADRTRYYIDPKTARVVSTYSSRNWMNRWLYHGLHSLDFPWLYNYRPLWDIVVITFMVGGTSLCVTSLILAWRVLGRKLARLSPGAVDANLQSEDLYNTLT